MLNVLNMFPVFCLKCWSIITCICGFKRQKPSQCIVEIAPTTTTISHSDARHNMYLPQPLCKSTAAGEYKLFKKENEKRKKTSINSCCCLVVHGQGRCQKQTSEDKLNSLWTTAQCWYFLSASKSCFSSWPQQCAQHKEYFTVTMFEGLSYEWVKFLKSGASDIQQLNMSYISVFKGLGFAAIITMSMLRWR